jgi:hypothetical protein
MELYENYVRNMYGGGCGGVTAPLPMLAFDILPSYGGGIGIHPWLFISFMCSSSFVLGYGG